MILKTRQLFSKRTVEILPAGIRVTKKDIFDSIEYEIPFENLHNRKKVQARTNNSFLVVAFFLIVFGLLFRLGNNREIATLLILSGLFFIILAILTRQRTVIIQTYDGSSVELFYDPTDKEKIVKFADKVIESADAYLLSKYTKVDKMLPIEPQIERLIHLRDRGILSDDKFNEYKVQLLGKDTQSQIGFMN